MRRPVVSQSAWAALCAAALVGGGWSQACAGDHAAWGPAAGQVAAGYGPSCAGGGHAAPRHAGKHGHCAHGHCGRGPCHHGHCGHGPCGHGCGACGGHGCGLCGPGACKYDAWEKRFFLRSQGKSWHSAWYDPAEGRPIALVVPPTSEFMTQYSWGVPSSRVAPIYHQFRRPYPGPGAVAGSGGGGFLPTPNQPSDTVQFGVNAVRGPWGAY